MATRSSSRTAIRARPRPPSFDSSREDADDHRRSAPQRRRASSRLSPPTPAPAAAFTVHRWQRRQHFLGGHICQRHDRRRLVQQPDRSSATTAGHGLNGVDVTVTNDAATGAETAAYSTASNTLTVHSNAASTTAQIVDAINADRRVQRQHSFKRRQSGAAGNDQSTSPPAEAYNNEINLNATKGGTAYNNATVVINQNAATGHETAVVQRRHEYADDSLERQFGHRPVGLGDQRRRHVQRLDRRRRPGLPMRPARSATSPPAAPPAARRSPTCKSIRPISAPPARSACK